MCKATDISADNTRLNPKYVSGDEKDRKTNEVCSARGVNFPTLYIRIALVLIGLFQLPSTFYLNRGYTIWYYYTSIIALILGTNFSHSFVIIQGIGINIGWYAVILQDIIANSRGFHILYANMPIGMKSIMFHQQTGALLNTSAAFKMKFFSHVLDILGHPCLTLAFMYSCLRTRKLRWKDVLTLPVIISAFGLARIWSLFHNYYNKGTVGIYYAGYDVYNIDSLDSWFYAYVSEGLFYFSVLSWRLGNSISHFITNRQKQKSI